MILKAPFPYFGGKKTVAPMVWERFGDCPNYVEPFFGSGAMLLGRPNPNGTETVNDLDGYVSCFWRAIQADPEAVAAYADNPVNECIPAGTMIATPNGNMAVEDVTHGTIVWGIYGGKLVETRVTATHQGLSNNLYQVGNLMLTGNHPVWTLESGYVQADLLGNGNHVLTIDNGVDKTDLVMLTCRHDEEKMGNIRVARSSQRTSQVCRHNASRQTANQRTHVACNHRGQDPSRLLDKVSNQRRSASRIRGSADRLRGGVAGRGTLHDSPLWRGAYQLHRGRRRTTWLYSDPRTSRKMVSNAKRSAVCTRAQECNDWQTTYIGSHRKDTRCQCGPSYARFHETENIGVQKRQTYSPKHHCCYISSKSRAHTHSRTQIQDCQLYHKSNTGCVRRNRRSFCFNLSRRQALQCAYSGTGYTSNTQGLSMRRVSLASSIAVYNFQTATGNYFAESILVHNCDLHARHYWLKQQRSELAARLEADPMYYDPQVAGWWAWGMSCWIGGGFCEANGPWVVIDGQLVKTGTQDGTWRVLPHLRGSGQGTEQQGVNRKRPQLVGKAGGNAMQAISQKRSMPECNHSRGVNASNLTDDDVAVNAAGAPNQIPYLKGTGMGVNQSGIPHGRPNLGGAGGGQGTQSPTQQGRLVEWFAALANRLARVRVCCGDWTRVTGPSVTIYNGLTGVFLDPPYDFAERSNRIYTSDTDCSKAVREWALENGDNQLYRIALCGYDGEHDMPESWECVAWKAGGGYANRSNCRGKENRHRERIWFSPHCLDVDISKNQAVFEI